GALASVRRRPPPPPLFPYTTLFRSPSRTRSVTGKPAPMRSWSRPTWEMTWGRSERRACSSSTSWHPPTEPHGCSCAPPPRYEGRSEEHTSELQSRFDLVCRLLLENN